MTDDMATPAAGPCPVAGADCNIDLGDTLNVHLWHEHTEEELADTLVRFALDNDRLRAELAEAAPRAWCQCCVFGNHTERCTCAAATCCHPERHPVPDETHLTRLATTVGDLRDRLDQVEAVCRRHGGEELLAAIHDLVYRPAPVQAAELVEEG